MKYSLLLFVLFLSKIGLSQDFSIDKIEPPNWWVGMKYDTVQLMVYGKNLKDVEIYPQHGPIEVINVHKAQSPNYLFVDLFISPEIKTNYNFEIGFSKGKQDTVIKFPILARENL